MKLDPRITGLNRRLRPAAESICVNLHPPKLRAGYVRDIRAKYHAPLIVYALQALSAGMTAIFLGLLTNYLYDKYKLKRRGHEESGKLEKLLAGQEENLKELRQLLKTEKSKRAAREGMASLKLHRKTLLKVKNKDASIELLLQESIELIETRGPTAVKREVDSNLDRHG